MYVNGVGTPERQANQIQFVILSVKGVSKLTIGKWHVIPKITERNPKGQDDSVELLVSFLRYNLIASNSD